MGPSQFDHEKLEGFVVLQRIEPGKAMLVRVVAMLTKLLERFDPEQFRVRESPSDAVLPFEHDDEHEHDSLVAATPLCALCAFVVNPSSGNPLFNFAPRANRARVAGCFSRP